MNSKLFLSVLLFVITGCATEVQLPSNVLVTPGDSSTWPYINKIDFSFKTSEVKEFSKLKLCVAKNVTNDTTTLEDSSGSFVGAYTGHYYNITNKQYAFGDNVFKYVDDSSSTIVATGTTSYVGGALDIIQYIVKFEAEIGLKGNNVILNFYRISRAQQSTGMIANNGFSPIPVAYGTATIGAYDSLKLIANNIKTCLI